MRTVMGRSKSEAVCTETGGSVDHKTWDLDYSRPTAGGLGGDAGGGDDPREGGDDLGVHLVGHHLDDRLALVDSASV